MSKRSDRFRASVDVPELGKVEVRGLSPDALRAIQIGREPTEEEIAAADTAETPPPAYVALIAAGCVRPRLSEGQLRELSRSSLVALGDAIMSAHPQTRRMLARESR